MVPADSHKASPTSRYSGSHYPIITYPYAALMLYGRVSHPVPVHFDIHIVVLQPPLCRNIIGLGFFPFARHYSGNHYCFLFLCLLRCFSSAGSRIYATILQIVRFPHSEIRGSIHICWSPRLIAAYHVLHRLWEPRHPPCTLSYFLLLIRFCSYSMLFWSDCRSDVQISRSRTNDRSPFSFFFLSLIQSQQPSLYCCLLFFNYFFQYVKELYPILNNG